MTKKTKIIIGVTSTLLVLSATILIINRVKKNKNNDDNKDDKNEKTDDKQVKSLVGKKVRVSSAETYANVRSSAEIKNKCSITEALINPIDCYSREENIIQKIEGTGKQIGKIKGVVSSSNDGFTWYKVNLIKKGNNGSNVGYVREDVVEVY